MSNSYCKKCLNIYCVLLPFWIHYSCDVVIIIGNAKNRKVNNSYTHSRMCSKLEHYSFTNGFSCHLFLIVRLFSLIGASSDFDSATKIAKMMVTRFGMSEKVRWCFAFIFRILLSEMI